ncbi:MAG: hypothetical protein LBM01_00105 [Christensenellaceae bacterium]|jgi:hypothetical protein|nr:hypothetical protein [Christensenellaceae bacterium]
MYIKYSDEFKEEVAKLYKNEKLNNLINQGSDQLERYLAASAAMTTDWGIVKRIDAGEIAELRALARQNMEKYNLYHKWLGIVRINKERYESLEADAEKEQ